MSNKRVCPRCKYDALVIKNFDSSVNVEGREYPVTGLEFSECQNCGNEAVFADQARRNDKIFADRRRSASGLLTSSEIAETRAMHGLTQQLCSRLFGGGANSFNKYESGAVIQSAAMDMVIRLIRDVPGALSYAARVKGIEGISESPAATFQVFSYNEALSIGWKTAHSKKDVSRVFAEIAGFEDAVFGFEAATTEFQLKVA